MGKKGGELFDTACGICHTAENRASMVPVLANVPSARNFTGGFGAELMLKDLTLVTDAARAAKHPVLLGALAQQIYQMHSRDGHGDKDFSRIILKYLK